MHRNPLSEEIKIFCSNDDLKNAFFNQLFKKKLGYLNMHVQSKEPKVTE